jgi:hypothetical protein
VITYGDRQAGRAWPRWLLGAVAAWCGGLGGCAGLWDDVTSNDFKVEELWRKPDPLWVIKNSPDGDKRAKALRALQEPATHDGTQQQQDVVVSVLVYSAASDSQALCRLAAIATLRNFKDPRAAKGLEEAYYRASNFNPETATVLRCQALRAMGDNGNPIVVDTLVRALREPPVEGPDADRQQKLDERVAAARSLSRFQHYKAASALVEVLKNEKDVALRDTAHESLVTATGKHLPPDPKAWNEYLEHPDQQMPNDSALVIGSEDPIGRFFKLVGFTSEK